MRTILIVARRVNDIPCVPAFIVARVLRPTPYALPFCPQGTFHK